jgi:hypothetical protein
MPIAELQGHSHSKNKVDVVEVKLALFFFVVCPSSWLLVLFSKSTSPTNTRRHRSPKGRSCGSRDHRCDTPENVKIKKVKMFSTIISVY